MAVRRARWLAPLLPAVLAAGIALGAACDNVTCKTITTDLGAVCLPDTAEPNRDLLVEVREQCSLNCARMPNCTATMVAGALVLDVHQDVCNDVASIACARRQCERRTAFCKLPGLPVGDYVVTGPGIEDQLLRVRAGGTPSCRLPALPDAGDSAEAGADGGV